MSNLGSMVLELSANTAKFQSDMGKIAQSATEAAERVTKTFERVGAAIGVGLGVEAFKGFIEGGIQAQEQALLFAQKVGIATDAVAGLVSEAKKFGVDQDSLQQAMTKLAKSAAEAGNGVKQYAAAYSALGINVKDANGNIKSTDVLLGEIADKFKGYKDGATKTADAVVLLGRAGANLIPLLNQGSVAIERQIQLAKDLGAATGTAAAKGAEEFKSKMVDLDLVSKGLSNQIATALLPALNKLAESAIKFFTSNTWKSWMDGVSSAFTSVANHLDDIIAGVKLLGELAVDYIGVRMASSVLTATARMAALAVATLAANSAAASMGLSFNAGVAASLKQIGYLNAAIGTVGAAVAGWQIGTYLYNQFAVVRTIANNFIATFDAVWTVVSAGAQGAWLAIEKAFYVMLDAVSGALSDSLAKMSANFAKLPDALGGSKLSAQFLALSAAIAPSGKSVTDLDAKIKTLSDNTAHSLKVIQTSWDTGAVAAHAAAKATDEAGEAAKKAAPNIAGLGKANEAAENAARALAEMFAKDAEIIATLRGKIDPVSGAYQAYVKNVIAANEAYAKEIDLAGKAGASNAAYAQIKKDQADKIDAANNALNTQLATFAREKDIVGQLAQKEAEELSTIGLTGKALEEANRLREASAKAIELYNKNLREAAALTDAETIAIKADADAFYAKSIAAKLSLPHDSPFTKMVKELQDVNHALEQARLGVIKLDNADLTKLHAAAKMLHLDLATGILGAASEALRGIQSFTKEGSKAYEEMRIAIDALAIAQAILAVIAQGALPPPASFVAMAAMAAAVAPLLADIGASISAVNSAGAAASPAAAAQMQASQGTGTILGDAAKQSQSIANATEITADATSKLVGISTGMLDALRSLQQALGGAANLLARGAGNATFPGFAGDVNAFNGFLSSHDPLGGDPLTKALSSLLFGGKQKLIDTGIDISGGASGLNISAYETIFKSGGLFGSDKTKNVTAALGDDFNKQISLVFGSIVDTVKEAAKALGIPIDDIQAKIYAFHVAETKISLKGLSAEDQQKALEAVFSSIFDGLAGAVVPFIAQFQQVGEGLGETLVRVATEVQVTQQAMKQLGLVINETDPEKFAQIADGLIKMAGGVDAFIEGMNSFTANFAPESFKFQTEQDALTSALQQVGLTLPGTREGFWQLMQSLDASTDAGQKQIATLLRLADVANAYYTALDKQQTDATQAAKDAAQANANFVASLKTLVQNTQQLADQLFGTSADKINARIKELMDFGAESGIWDFRQITALKKELADQAAQQQAAQKLVGASSLLANFGQLGALTGEDLNQLAQQFNVPLDKLAGILGTDQAGLAKQFAVAEQQAQAALGTEQNTKYANELLANILAAQLGLPQPYSLTDINAAFTGTAIATPSVGGKPTPIGGRPPGPIGPQPVASSIVSASSKPGGVSTVASPDVVSAVRENTQVTRQFLAEIREDRKERIAFNRNMRDRLA
jgi:hypothetical protein